MSPRGGSVPAPFLRTLLSWVSLASTLLDSVFLKVPSHSFFPFFPVVQFGSLVHCKHYTACPANLGYSKGSLPWDPASRVGRIT